jgi:opacity protein-like surface antigen
MRRFVPLAVALIVLLAATPKAHAIGVFAGGSVGDAGFKLDENNIDFDESDFAYKFFGGVRLGSIFAVEASYNDFGEAEDSNLSVKSKAYGIFGRIGLPVWRLDIFAKGGIYQWEVDVEAGSTSGSDDGSDLAYGAGVSLRFTESLVLRAEYEVFQIDTDDADADLDMVSLGLEWRFFGN